MPYTMNRKTWGSVISPVKHIDGWATQPRRSALSAATTAPWLALTMPYIASVSAILCRYLRRSLKSHNVLVDAKGFGHCCSSRAGGPQARLAHCSDQGNGKSRSPLGALWLVV